MVCGLRCVLISVGFSLLCATGCADAEVGATESDLTQTLTLRFESTDGVLVMRSSGRRLECYERFEGLAGERVTCARTGETVQAIVKSTGDSVVAVRDMDGQRGYYTCTPSGDVEGLPALMNCKITTIRPRGSGGLSSPFDSTVAGISVPNSHWTDVGETVLRGMEPRTAEQYDELRAAGIEKVLIFKNSTTNDTVGAEIATWALPAEDVLHVPFQWKGLDGFQTPCEQTVEALRFIRAAEADARKLFFHCTVGEDRTGYLAAVYALLFEGADARSAFADDMCEHGYSSGNPQKPGYVVGVLAAEVTPLYRSMAYLVSEGVLDAALDLAACASEPTVPANFLSEPLTCGVSTMLVP